MPTLDEIGNAEQVTKEVTTGVNEPGDMPIDTPMHYQETNKLQELLKKILTAETGAGGIEDYIEHPLNFLKSKGFAQMLRGFTGIFGSLSLAVIDIVLGSLQFSKERKQGAGMNDVSNGGGFPS